MLLPDCLGPVVLDAGLDQEPEASASYTEREPTAKPTYAKRTAILSISASQVFGFRIGAAGLVSWQSHSNSRAHYGICHYCGGESINPTTNEPISLRSSTESLRTTTAVWRTWCQWNPSGNALQLLSEARSKLSYSFILPLPSLYTSLRTYKRTNQRIKLTMIVLWFTRTLFKHEWI